MKKLTPRQARFVEEYLVDLNAKQAAIRAGYSAKTAEVLGYETLRYPHVAAAIAAAKAARSERTNVEQDRVVLELARLAFSDVRKAFREDGGLKAPHELDDATAAAVSSIEFDPNGGFKVRLWDKNSAADKLMKHLGAYEQDNRQAGRGLAEAVQLIVRGVKPGA